MTLKSAVRFESRSTTTQKQKYNAKIDRIGLSTIFVCNPGHFTVRVQQYGHFFDFFAAQRNAKSTPEFESVFGL